MKAVIELEERIILPNIKFDNPNPKSKYCDLVCKIAENDFCEYSPMGESSSERSDGANAMARKSFGTNKR